MEIEKTKGGILAGGVGADKHAGAHPRLQPRWIRLLHDWRFGLGLCLSIVAALVIGASAFFSSDMVRDGVVANNYLAGAYPEINAIDRQIEQLYARSQNLASEGRAIDGTSLSLAMRGEYDRINERILQLMQQKEALLKNRASRP